MLVNLHGSERETWREWAVLSEIYDRMALLHPMHFFMTVWRQSKKNNSVDVQASQTAHRYKGQQCHHKDHPGVDTK